MPTLNIHLPTVFLLTFITSLMMSTAMFITARALKGRVAGMITWALACVIHACSWAAFGLQFFGFELIASLLGNSFSFFAVVLTYRAVCQLLELPPGRFWPWWLLWALMTVGVWYWTMMTPDYPARVVVTSVAFAVPNIFTTWVIFRESNWRKLNSFLLTGVGFAVLSIGFILRATAALLQPDLFPGIEQPNLVQDIFYIAANVWIVSLTFGFVLMAYEQLNTRLEVLAARDSLTGIYNRRMIEEFLGVEILAAARTAQPLAVLMLDLDSFKPINDKYGHQVGDRVLRAFAATLEKTVRAHDLIGRMGGEEFLVVLPNTDRKSTLIVAERLRKAVAEMVVMHQKNPIQITVSIGGALLTAAINSHISLLQVADHALYTAKADGRNRVVLAEEATPPPEMPRVVGPPSELVEP